MLHVGVCDDEQILARRLGASLRKMFAERGVDAGISIFLSGKRLLEKAELLDLVFLDIDMPFLDGVETGKRLRLRNPDCAIVMVSAMEHRMKEGYVVGARRFVTKPVEMEELREAVDAVLEISPGTEQIRLFLNNHPYEVRQNQIDYLEAYNGYTLFHVNGKLFRREENLKHFLNDLDSRLFAQISRKYIVNLAHARPGGSGDTLCVAEVSIPVPRRQREGVLRKYMEYDLRFGGR